jgi:hypothetical protein
MQTIPDLVDDEEIPWKVIDTSVISRMPSFVAEEFMWFSIIICCFFHASSRKSGVARRNHHLLFITAILGGVANDIIFMYLPLVDNFWQ